MIRAVVTDLDGTIVRSDGTISPRMAAAARTLADRGIPLIAATARTHFGVGAAGLDFTLSVCSSGAIGWHHGDRVWRETFPHPAVRDVADAILRLPGAGVGAHDGDQWFMTEAYAGLNGWRSRGPMTIVDPAELPPTSCVMAACAPDLSPFALIEALELDPALATLSTAGRNVVDITPSGVDKGTGVLRALAYLGIDPADVVAFGDMVADIPMFGVVGLGVSVGTAHPDVVAAAGHVAPDAESDGVPETLTLLGLL